MAEMTKKAKPVAPQATFPTSKAGSQTKAEPSTRKIIPAAPKGGAPTSKAMTPSELDLLPPRLDRLL